jgi:hypothetical protein
MSITKQYENESFSPLDWAKAIDGAGLEMAEASGAHDCSITALCWPAVYGYCIAKGCSDQEAFVATATSIDLLLSEYRARSGTYFSGGQQRQILFDLTADHLERCRSNGWHSIAPQVEQPRNQINIIEPLLEGMLTSTNPEEAFARLWGASIVLTAMLQTREECYDEGLEPHWNIFVARVLHPSFKRTPKEEYSFLLGVWGVPDYAHAAVMITRIQRRFARQIRSVIQETVDDELQVDPELNELRRALHGVGMVEAICEPLRWACRVEHDPATLAADIIAFDIAGKNVESFFLESPSIEELIKAKNCYKTLRLMGEHGVVERRRGAYLYLIAIATAMVNYDQRISSQSNDALRRGLGAMSNERRLPRSLRVIAVKALKLLD